MRRCLPVGSRPDLLGILSLQYTLPGPQTSTRPVPGRTSITGTHVFHSIWQFTMTACGGAQAGYRAVEWGGGPTGSKPSLTFLDLRFLLSPNFLNKSTVGFGTVICTCASD